MSHRAWSTMRASSSPDAFFLLTSEKIIYLIFVRYKEDGGGHYKIKKLNPTFFAISWFHITISLLVAPYFLPGKLLARKTVLNHLEVVGVHRVLLLLLGQNLVRSTPDNLFHISLSNIRVRSSL